MPEKSLLSMEFYAPRIYIKWLLSMYITTLTMFPDHDTSTCAIYRISVLTIHNMELFVNLHVVCWGNLLPRFYCWLDDFILWKLIKIVANIYFHDMAVSRCVTFPMRKSFHQRSCHVLSCLCDNACKRSQLFLIRDGHYVLLTGFCLYLTGAWIWTD